ncbi:MlaE family ABC transporter permease [Oleisolibacter albus]|uniref:MlaE family ABC transporter permease n=1 Tax=Oleisolibacter albus TaxID=2171757 RepID=UPI000DF273DB|nr:ABC transporter permease [Oleisolibacter albus]
MSTPFRQEADGLVLRIPDGGLDQTLLGCPLSSLGIDPGRPVRWLRLEAPAHWSWGTADAAFLDDVLRQLTGEAIRLDGVPRDLQALMSLARGTPSAQAAPAPRQGLRERVGLGVLAWWRETLAMVALIGDMVLRLPRLLTGRAMVRRSEILDVLAESSTRAIVIVSVVNLLMGAILAFVGAVQLKTFGAGLYVADLVGIASVRELAPVMTAIVLAGRTGASFAARIATMQGNEEIDALTTLRVPPEEFLVLPRVAALSLLMPLLYVYACLLSLIGGMIVATLMLDVTATGYLIETQAAIKSANFAIGGLKSVVFGALVALIGCRCGLRAGRSAADVGQATTAAVVNAIVAIIAVDALFAVCANALGV